MASAASIPVTIDNPAIDYDTMGGGNAGQGVQVLQTGGVTQPIMGSFLQHFSAGPAPFTVFPVDIFCTAADAGTASAYAGGKSLQIPQFQGAGPGARFVIVGAFYVPKAGGTTWVSPGGTPHTILQVDFLPRKCNVDFPPVNGLRLLISWLTSGTTYAKALTLDGTNLYGSTGLGTSFQVGDYIRISQTGGTDPYIVGDVSFRLLLSRVA